MKSFSIKALALAFAAVAGSTHGYTGEVFVNDAYKQAESVDRLLFGEKGTEYVQNGITTQVSPSKNPEFFDEINGSENTEIQNSRKDVLIGGLPILNSYLRFENGYARAAVVTVAGAAVVAGISAAAYKTYKYFRPDAEEAVEGDNVEANEATTVA